MSCSGGRIESGVITNVWGGEMGYTNVVNTQMPEHEVRPKQKPPCFSEPHLALVPLWACYSSLVLLREGLSGFSGCPVEAVRPYRDSWLPGMELAFHTLLVESVLSWHTKKAQGPSPLVAGP